MDGEYSEYHCSYFSFSYFLAHQPKPPSRPEGELGLRRLEPKAERPGSAQVWGLCGKPLSI